MKSLFTTLAIVASFSALASNVQTTFKAQVRFHRADGKVKNLRTIRVISRTSSEASLLHPSAIEDCAIQAGKEDLLSLNTPADRYTCLATKNTLMMSSETLQSIVDRSIEMTIFSSNSLFYTLQNMIDNGKVNSDAPGGSANALLNRLGRSVLGVQTTELMRLDGPTHYTIQDERGLESFDVSLSVSKVEYLN